MSTKNEINIKINVSDDLLNKFMTAMMASQSPLPMIAGMLPMAPEGKESDKAPIGFNRQTATKGSNGK